MPQHEISNNFPTCGGFCLFFADLCDQKFDPDLMALYYVLTDLYSNSDSIPFKVMIF